MGKEIPNCKRFTGYKPCYPDHNCWEDGCKDNELIGTKILIINLDAMGDVLMTTAQLPSIKKKYPESSIYWLTLGNAAGLLENNSFIHKILVYGFESISILNELEFDLIMNVDKSVRSGAIAMSVKTKKKLGFGINSNGIIIPLNKGAEYNYRLGMDDHLKFKINQRTGQDYLAETFELEYERNDYVFNFNEEELRFIEKFTSDIGVNDKDEIIGINTGCSNLFPNKKMTIEGHLSLIERLLYHNRFKIMLLGGLEDTERNKVIYNSFEGKIINTPTNYGIRKGACFESIPQVVITGDSFGMHLAIALKKFVIVWFGLSCWSEIDLYDRGVKLFQKNLECSPCWKKVCPYNLECIQMIDLKRMEREAVNFFDRMKIQSKSSS